VFDQRSVELVLRTQFCRVVLNEIEFSKRRFKIPQSEIMKSPKEWKNRAFALNNIAVFDLAPLEESPVKKRLFAKLNDA
jgi:hypothetical protein